MTFEYERSPDKIYEQSFSIIRKEADLSSFSNLEEKIAEINSKTGNTVMFVITPKGYENLALGIAELRRYVKDQQAIIAYYEEALTPEEPKAEVPTE